MNHFVYLWNSSRDILHNFPNTPERKTVRKQKLVELLRETKLNSKVFWLSYERQKTNISLLLQTKFNSLTKHRLTFVVRLSFFLGRESRFVTRSLCKKQIDSVKHVAFTTARKNTSAVRGWFRIKHKENPLVSACLSDTFSGEEKYFSLESVLGAIIIATGRRMYVRGC